MQVVCETCGVEEEVMHPLDDGDPDQDGWLYETETRTFQGTMTDPTGSVVTVPMPYRHPVARSIVWLCANGHTSTVTEPLEETV